SAQEVSDGSSAATIRHVQHIDAGHQLEQFTRQVDGAAVTGRGKGDFTRVGLRVVDEFLHAAVGTLRIHHQQVRHHGDTGQGLKILDVIEIQLAVQRGVDGVRAHRAHQERIAVSLGACSGLRTDVATGAIAVFDYDALVKLGAQILAHD